MDPDNRHIRSKVQCFPSFPRNCQNAATGELTGTGLSFRLRYSCKRLLKVRFVLDLDYRWFGD